MSIWTDQANQVIWQTVDSLNHSAIFQIMVALEWFDNDIVIYQTHALSLSSFRVGP